MRTTLALIFAFLAPLFAAESPARLTSTLEKSFTKRSADFPKVDGGALDGDDRTAPLLHLRYLLEMEAIVREFLNDATELKQQVEHEDFSGSEKKRIIKMRAEAAQHRTSSLVAADFKEPRSSPVVKLHKAYARNAKRSLSEISRNRKSLNRELDRNRPDERRVEKLEKQIDEAEQVLSKIQVAFFGNLPRKGFEAPLPEGEDSHVAALLTKVITARDKLLITLRLDPKLAKAKDRDVKKGEVGGIHVRSSNLGIILDNSSSMQPHIPALRTEIDGAFPGSRYREVYGCALTWQAGPTKLRKRDLVMLAMEDLIIVKKADALYWFSDLHDVQSEPALIRPDFREKSPPPQRGLLQGLAGGRIRARTNSTNQTPSRDSTHPLLL